ncbi:hypothetical protein Bpfe_001991 [Biomphalaria pfeifferi]|uniref:Uncharacterized protein n=1 Tax=Biomphalaria pfeifferi TaxID=112525 RepID=A0AAD8C7X3_BIOPF|nr:hypothetical protein Bpfe_001991 [Biomphalaria pfeifferi]
MYASARERSIILTIINIDSSSLPPIVIGPNNQSETIADFVTIYFSIDTLVNGQIKTYCFQALIQQKSSPSTQLNICVLSASHRSGHSGEQWTLTGPQSGRGQIKSINDHSPQHHSSQFVWSPGNVSHLVNNGRGYCVLQKYTDTQAEGDVRACLPKCK